ncbi:hypothetical protein Avbf_13205 [Armadillidium vulgare]|nr:hypothetical protein Avbf_13205 [Armadillidium vulgare]
MIKILHLFYIPACWHIVFLMLYVPGIDSNLRIKSTSHCVFSDATKLNLMEGVFEK